jgi:probable F420-dependent oxidoreductase
MVRLGSNISNRGHEVTPERMVDTAIALEESGCDSVWLSDHIVLVDGAASAYPYSGEDRPHTQLQDARTPWYEALVSSALLAQVTTTVEIGVAVLVLPQRNVVEVAKATSTIDHIAKGRFVLGVGSGWQRGEFEALGHRFETRGKRLDEGLELLRSCWTGTPPPFAGAELDLPSGVHCYPTPFERASIPILVGGVSEPARRRAAQLGDGWLATGNLRGLSIDELRRHIAALRTLRNERGAVENPYRDVFRLLGIDTTMSVSAIAETVGAIAEIGFDEVVVDLDLQDASPAETGALMAELRQVV